MVEFFQGWRRKVGCSLLFASLVLMGFWIRGYCREDYLEFTWLNTVYSAASGYGYFQLTSVRFDPHQDAMPPIKSVDVSWSSTPLTDVTEEITPWNGATTESHWKLGPIICGNARYTGSPRFQKSYVLVPSSLIVLPLTLLSAYALLWPSRRIKPQSKLDTDPLK